MYSACIDNDYITGVAQISEGKKTNHKKGAMQMYFYPNISLFKVVTQRLFSNVILQCYYYMRKRTKKTKPCHSVAL